MRRRPPAPATGSASTAIPIPPRRDAPTRNMRITASHTASTRSEPGDQLRLDRLVFGVGDEALVDHVLGALQTRRHLLEVADAALLAPGLIVGLADAVHLLGLRRTQAAHRAPERRAIGAAREIGTLVIPDAEVGPEQSHANVHGAQVLPADVVHRVARDEVAREDE